MPYIYVENIEEGMEEADVVGRADYDAVVSDRDAVIVERDELVAQNEGLANRVAESEAETRAAKKKYADMFVTSRDKAIENHKRDVVKDENSIRGIDDLWKERA